MPSAYPMGSASCSANGVGIMPAGVRTNRSSPNVRRSLASVLLTAGWVSSRFAATLETLRSTISCWNTTSWFRSMSVSSMESPSFLVIATIRRILFAELPNRVMIGRPNRVRHGNPRSTAQSCPTGRTRREPAEGTSGRPVPNVVLVHGGAMRNLSLPCAGRRGDGGGR